jgi:hypothetical protein
MKSAAIAAVAAAMLVGGAASASERVSDSVYLKANRCRGLATTLTGVVDSSGLDAFVKSEGRTRHVYIAERAEAEFGRAKREARSQDRKARLTAELTGPCSAFLGGASSVAKQ